MSVLNTVDLTLYGCPLHYIKARGEIQKLDSGQALLLKVNTGDAEKEVMASLVHDGHHCERVAADNLTAIIRVTKS